MRSQTSGAKLPCRCISEHCCYSAPKDSRTYEFARFTVGAAAARPQATIGFHLWNRRDLDGAPSYRRSYFSGFCKCTIIHRCSGMTQWYHIHYFYFLPSCFGVGFRSTPVAWIGRPEAGWSCSAVVRRCRRCRVKGRGSTVCWIGRTRLRFLAISLDGCFGMGYGQCLNGLQMIRIRWKILFIILDFEFKAQNRAFTYLRFKNRQKWACLQGLAWPAYCSSSRWRYWWHLDCRLLHWIWPILISITMANTSEANHLATLC